MSPKRTSKVAMLVLGALALACGSKEDPSPASGGSGGSGGSAGSTGGSAGSSATAGSNAGTGGNAGAPPFEHPDPPLDYVPQDGTCGFDEPAFCDTFESGPKDGGRSGELDPAHWSVV
ncbi:MAG TPA: hypothetical protein VNN72_24230, partial [Polyangiaceae bacterium]|nr:hypothetical protein [Polyangiaceae bacterium]